MSLLLSEQFLGTVVVAGVCSLACAVLGCWLVVKRMSLLGDAINHGLLPGIVVAVLISGQLTSIYLFVGAMFFGILTAFLTQTLHEVGGVSEDASLGVVFTTLFALGVLMITAFLRGAHIDVDCVFQGHLETVSTRLDEVLPTQLFALAVTIAFTLLLWKELKLAIFDADLATALGFRATLLHYLLVALVAGVAVSAFEAVGSILVLAMLIVPAITAQFWTQRLAMLFVIAAAVSLLSAFLGCALALWLDTNAAGMLAVVAGGLFFVSLLVAPRHGVLARILRTWNLSLRIAGEDMLSALYRSEEKAVPAKPVTQPEHGFSPLFVHLALLRLRRLGWIEGGPDWRLTGAGRDHARNIVRAHRLWEAFLDRNFELPLDHLHSPATLMEHFLGPELQKRLEAELDSPHRDPHGQSIPNKPSSNEV